MIDRDSPSALTESYATWVSIIVDESPLTCNYAVFEALTVRSMIEDVWDKLTTEEQEEVIKSDDVLMSVHERVADSLATFIYERRWEPEHWWYHLDEGPQVREEAERARSGGGESSGEE